MNNEDEPDGSEFSSFEDAEEKPQSNPEKGSLAFYVNQLPSTPLPRSLYSVETGQPFEKCLVSGADLLEENQFYIIQKNYHDEEVLFEMAITVEVSRGMNESLSEKSRDRLSEYLWENIDFATRYLSLYDANNPASLDFDRWTDRCVFNGLLREASRSRSIIALCRGRHLLYLPNSPMMLGDDALRMIDSLLSEETRRFFDGFINEHVPTAPAAQNLPGSPLVIG